MRVVELHKNGSASEAFRMAERPSGSVQKGQVKIKVAAFGLNYADVMARKGLYADAPPLPAVLGYEVVGSILECGPESGFSIGDRVLGFTLFGGYAEEVITDERTVVKLPDTISDAEGTALGTQYCTAYYAGVEMASMQPGETVLVHAAAGGVGTALVQLAKWRGCTVIGTAGSNDKLDYLNLQGVDFAINYRANEYKEAILSNKVPTPDVVFNPIGGKSFKKDMALLNKGGRMVLFGVSTWSDTSGGSLAKLKLAWDFGLMHPIQLLMKSQMVGGLNMLRIAEKNPLIIRNCMQAVVDLTVQGNLKPHVGAEFNASQLPEAHKQLEERGSIGKIAISW